MCLAGVAKCLNQDDIFCGDLPLQEVFSWAPWSLHAVFSSLRTAGTDNPPHEQTRLMMGTLVSISTRSPMSQQTAEAVEAAFAEASRLESLLTRHVSSAPLGLLNRQGAIRDIPPELRQVLSLSFRISTATKNAFNPLAVTVTEAKRQGVRGNGLKRIAELSKPEALRLDDSGLRLESSELLCSLDGIAKGFIVDAISGILNRHGVSDHLINAGGDIFAAGSPGRQRPWTVGIMNSDGRIARVVPLCGMALATSGNSESLARGYEHILPAHFSAPDARRLFSASAMAANAALADAYSTALFALDPAQAEKTAAGGEWNLSRCQPEEIFSQTCSAVQKSPGSSCRGIFPFQNVCTAGPAYGGPGVFQHTPQYGIIEYTAILFTHRAAKAHQTQRMIVRRPPERGMHEQPSLSAIEHKSAAFIKSPAASGDFRYRRVDFQNGQARVAVTFEPCAQYPSADSPGTMIRMHGKMLKIANFREHPKAEQAHWLSSVFPSEAGCPPPEGIAARQ